MKSYVSLVPTRPEDPSLHYCPTRSSPAVPMISLSVPFQGPLSSYWLRKLASHPGSIDPRRLQWIACWRSSGLGVLSRRLSSHASASSVHTPSRRSFACSGLAASLARSGSTSGMSLHRLSRLCETILGRRSDFASPLTEP